MKTSSAVMAGFACVLALGAFGCDQLGMGKAPAAEQAPAAAAAPAGGANSCADYAKKVCDEAGADSPACASFTSATELMSPGACAAGIADFAATQAKLGDAKKVCVELETKLCKELGEDSSTCEMVRAQTKTFPPDRCSMMMEHFPEVLADLQRIAARDKPLADELVAEIAKADAPSFGPEAATVTVVEFSDFECPFCSRAANVATQVKEKYGDKVRFVFRQFPLSFHQKAHLAAQASLAAHAQGKFWEFHDKLFADQSKLDRESLEASAEAIGLDLAKFKAALDGESHKATVDADLELGQKVNVEGTPTMFINGKRVADPTNFEVVSQAIEGALAGKAG